jgi:hypothetical protein
MKSLAYYATEFLMAVKKFCDTRASNVIKLFTDVIYEFS